MNELKVINNNIKITLLKNPFNPSDIEISYVEYTPKKSAYDYVSNLLIDNSIIISCNGLIVDEKFIPSAGDNIAVCCTVSGGNHGKNLINAIAMIALASYAGVIAQGGAWAGKSWILNGIYAAGVMMVGGAIINHFCPASSDSSNSSNTYSWEKTSVSKQGGVLYTTFGTMQTQGTLLSEHISYSENISTENQTQYYSLIFTGGEGELTSITDIEINENPISYYEDVISELRVGTNDQDPLENFKYAYADKSLGYELLCGQESWASGRNTATDQTEGDGGNGLEIVFSFPQGLCYVNDSGSYSNASVTVKATYCKLNSDGSEGEWKSFGEWTITNDVATSFYAVYSKTDLDMGKYRVSCTCLGKSGVSTRYLTRVYWSTLTHIIPTNFARPNKSVIALKMKATSQLSGSTPTITWVQNRSVIWIYDNEAKAYDTRPANNPAWACYDIIHGIKRLKNINTGQLDYIFTGVSKTATNYFNKFKAWADYCDSQNLKFNYIFNSVTDFWDALKIPEAVGRGKVILQGTSYSCICDAPSEVTQLFTMGNIIRDSFKETWLPLKDRADSVEITICNAAKSYTTDVVTIYSDTYDEEDGFKNPTQITLEGCTSYSQACLHGKYLLRLNKYLLRSVSFSADIDAITCQLGDVIAVAHDVLDLDDTDEITGSGRIISATSNTVTLDKKVLMLPSKNYGIIIRSESGELIQNAVYNETTETDTLTLAGNFTNIPEAYSVYNFAPLVTYKDLYRVVNISRDGKLQRTLSLLEYFDEIYEDDGVIPDRYTEPTNTPTVPNVTNLTCTQEYYVTVSGYKVSNIIVSYTIPLGVTRVAIYASTDGGTSWAYQGTTTASYYVVNNAIIGSSYIVKVVSISVLGAQSTGVTSDAITITGNDSPPPDVDYLLVEKTSGGNYRFTFALTNPPADLAGFKFKYNIGNSTNWDNAITLTSELITSSPYETQAFNGGGTYSVLIKAVDYAKNESTNAEYAIIGLGDEEIANIVWEDDMSEFTGSKTNGYVPSTITTETTYNMWTSDTTSMWSSTTDPMWEGTTTTVSTATSNELLGTETAYKMWNTNNTTMMWANDTTNMWTEIYEDMIYQDSFTPDSAGYLSFSYAIQGSYVIYYKRRFPYAMWGSNTDSMWNDDTDSMWRAGNWLSYLGKVEITAETYDLKIVVSGGKIRPEITEFKVIVDVPDLTESFNDIIISSSGTRLSIKNSYKKIKVVHINLQDSTLYDAVDVKVVDRNPNLGPLICAYNSNGFLTKALIDATIEGY